MNQHEVLLRLKNVSKVYQMGEVEVPALKEVSVDIMSGDFVAVIGASGSGKSTMMNLLGCLDLPTSGRIFLKGKDITRMPESDLATLRGGTIGFIFQQYHLIPSITAFENVALPLEFLEYGDAETTVKVKRLFSLVGLNSKMNNLPTQLSGGEQQRVSIARSLAADPEVILADEPTGALDSVTGRNILELLHKLWKEEGKTVIVVSHDLRLAKYARTIIELKDGRIKDVRRRR